ncbi:hypothetical protein ACRYI5_01315 [Furfurilactobacillus sp. WILCCON 0119]
MSIFDWAEQVPKGAVPMAPETNNYRLMQLVANMMGDVTLGLETMAQWLSIDEAKGEALDAIGTNYDEYRGEADDRFYRFMIKSKIAVARSKGTANDIINIIAGSLDVTPEQIQLVNNRDADGQVLSISIQNLPLSWVSSDFEKRYIIRRVQEAVALGVRINDITFVDISHGMSVVVGAASHQMIYDIKTSQKGA